MFNDDLSGSSVKIADAKFLVNKRTVTYSCSSFKLARIFIREHVYISIMVEI